MPDAPPAVKAPEPTFMDDMVKAFTPTFAPEPAKAPPAPAAATPPAPSSPPPPEITIKQSVPELVLTNEPKATTSEPPKAPDEPADEPATSPRSADWQKLKANRNEWRQKYEAHEKTIADLKKQLESSAKAPNTEEVERVRKEAEELRKSLQAVAIEKDPRFQQHFGGRIKGVLDKVKSIAGDNGQKIVELIQQPDSPLRTQSLEAAIDDLPQMSKLRIGALVNDLESIYSERDAEIAKSHETFRAMQGQQQQNAQANQARVREAMASQVNLARKNLAVFQTREGDEEWNKQVNSRVGLVEHILTGQLSPEELARAATWSAAAPALLQEISARDETIKSLNERIAALSSAKPDPSKNPGSVKPPGIPDEMSYGDAVASLAFSR